MTFEEQIAKLNEFFFFKEFTFSKTTFQPESKTELELADNIIFLDGLLLIYQVKERHAPEDSTPDNEATWFTGKVIKKGTRQIRDTLRYLSDYCPIKVRNHRGHSFKLVMEGITHFDKLVVYYPDDKLPSEYLKIKHHHSSTAGVIHLIPAVDYLGICRTFITPVEVHYYLTFREKLCNTWSDKLENIPEQAIVGQYLAGAFDAEPDTSFIDYLMSLQQNRSEWDMSGIIRHFQDSITTGNPPTDYYKIISEIAKLKRSELKEFKIRFILAIEKARKNEFDLPYRIAAPRTGCGFVFVPTTTDLKENRIAGLKKLTYAHKYDLKFIKCVGVSFLFETNGFFEINWCYLSFPWRYDPEIEKKLKENNPFRKVKTHEASPYSFHIDFNYSK